MSLLRGWHYDRWILSAILFATCRRKLMLTTIHAIRTRYWILHLPQFERPIVKLTASDRNGDTCIGLIRVCVAHGPGPKCKLPRLWSVVKFDQRVAYQRFC